jgi:hypothetical protein
MKQHITKEQWDEMRDCDKRKVLPVTDLSTQSPPNIGQMIEFLGGELSIEEINCYGYRVASHKGCRIPRFELCDSLWEAVKYKLNT